jgi:hypothetical protein
MCSYLKVRGQTDLQVCRQETEREINDFKLCDR